MIFDESTLRKLHALTLVANKVRAGSMTGDRRSTKKGSSQEFADYRDYVPGDDLRRLDWKVYARLERPFIKLFEEEEDVAVHILVDASRSMDWGDAVANKFTYARRLAAALGTIALAAGDQLSVALLQQDRSAADLESRQGLGAQYGPAVGRQHTLRLMRFLEAQQASGYTVLNFSLRNYALGAHRPGLTFLISDLFSPDGFQDGLRQLQGRGHELALLHLLNPEEIEPPLAGDLRLVDVETGAKEEVSLDGGLRGLYRQRVREWQAEVRSYCRSREIHYLAVRTDLPWDRLVLHQMRVEGIVR